MNRTKTYMPHRWKYEGETSRLDQCLKQKFYDISRAYLQTLLLAEKVTVNTQPGRKGLLVKAGDIIEMEAFIHPDDRTIVIPDAPSLDVFRVFDSYIIIEKSAGIATHVNDFSDHHAISNHFVGLYPEALGVGEDRLRPGVVHRLDTNTSGLLILARTQASFDAFRGLFNQRLIYKTYMALVLGRVLDPFLEIKTPLAHHAKNPRKMVAITDDRTPHRSTIREATTQVSVKKMFEGATLVEVKTLTGRMHQVRIHLSSIGHPLVGDHLYQDGKQRQMDRFGLNRHFLHACELKFKDPWTEESMHFESELSDDLKSCIKSLKNT